MVSLRPLNVLNRLRALPARLAFDASNARPMRRVLGAGYARAVDRHGPAVPRLSGLDGEIVDGLDREGVFVTSLAALSLPGSDRTLATICRLAEGFAEEALQRARTGAEFLFVPPGETMANPEIFAWGLADRLLDIAEAYIGLPVAYDGMNVVYTVADGRQAATRQWHRDREDRRMIKIAVYCNDVADDGGPFQLMTRPDPAQTDAAGYRYYSATDEGLRACHGGGVAADIVNCVGPAGTVVFADTARFFHRGKPAVGRDRGAAFYSYFAKVPRHPYFCARSGLSQRQLRALAAPMSERQRASVLWRDTLPMPARLIPTVAIA